jgi:2-oxoglutarate ferredoxin oxidoreductase subunit alpha
MEPVTLPERMAPPAAPAWATTGGGRERRIINSIYLEPEELERHVRELMATYQEIRDREQRWEAYHTDDADLIVVAYGIAARITRSAVDRVRQTGLRVGLIRPITLWPFPTAAFERAPGRYLVVEMSSGMMVEDVQLAAAGRVPVEGYYRLGGMVPTPVEIAAVIQALVAREVVPA